MAFSFSLGEENRGALYPVPSLVSGTPRKWWSPRKRMAVTSASEWIPTRPLGHQTCLRSQEGGNGDWRETVGREG